MTTPWNLARLSHPARALLLITFLQTHNPDGGRPYLIEVKLSPDPLEHLLFGGSGLNLYGAGADYLLAPHWGDPGWAVVHARDLPMSEAERDFGRVLLESARVLPVPAKVRPFLTRPQ
jgi:hypothetical protein